MTTDDAAWLAGIIDGEGTITTTVGRAGSQGRTSTSYLPRIAVSMCDRAVIEEVQRITGVGRTSAARPPSWTERNWRMAYEWNAHGRATVPIIEAIYPRLIAKRAQARAAWVMATLPRLTILSQAGRARLDPIVVRRREQMHLIIRALNQKQLGADDIRWPDWSEEVA